MAKQAIDFSAVEAAVQAIGDSNYAQGAADQAATDGVPVSPGSISQAQEDADITAAVQSAVQPLNDQITALNLAKSQEDSLLASTQDVVGKIRALLQ